MNLFREAEELLQKKDSGTELTEEELKLLNDATAFVANELPRAFPNFDDMPCSTGLEELAKIVEEGT